MRAYEILTEAWSKKYKSSINCSHPKGFSQKAHCAGKKKHNESIETEHVCPDCGMCETHGNHMLEAKQRLDAKCWKGKHKEGTKMKGGIRVNNCVPNESVEEAGSPAQQAAIAINMKKHHKKPKNEDVYTEEELNLLFDSLEQMFDELGIHEDNYDAFTDENILSEAAAWQKKSGKNKNGGLNKKGVKSYRREHPGSHLQTAVTTKPSKLKKGSKASKRRKSFCARMKGMKKHRTGAKTKRDPNSRINKSLRKWHC
jgi:hypothetical protein